MPGNKASTASCGGASEVQTNNTLNSNSLLDIVYDGYPYNSNPIEHHLGLVFANDTIKPGYQFYVTFANNLIKGNIPVPELPANNAIGIYWPTEVDLVF